MTNVVNLFYYLPFKTQILFKGNTLLFLYVGR